ncbi:hypothetical protein SCLCIDRAFT_927818 [Scleroderma citrinum Foug A]|uniref:Uncharacterized protein n=1 Tax=Scleroderma citrinum Foug A TaxID=1036808 RepID=A0A0C2ZGG9_9AGAM|nr:hypothetical protein SCLCIDRAFT_927818 [Scleroderma citrinum Foug A]
MENRLPTHPGLKALNSSYITLLHKKLHIWPAWCFLQLLRRPPCWLYGHSAYQHGQSTYHVVVLGRASGRGGCVACIAYYN